MPCPSLLRVAPRSLRVAVTGIMPGLTCSSARLCLSLPQSPSGLSYVDFDRFFGGHGTNIKVALAVATFKVCLVAAYFMHLKSERWSIWGDW